MAKITIEIDCDCPHCVHAIQVAIGEHLRQRRGEPSAWAWSYVFETYNVEGEGLKEVLTGMERAWRRAVRRIVREQQLEAKRGHDTGTRPCRHGFHEFRESVMTQADRLALDERSGRSQRGTARPSADDLMDQEGGLGAADAGSSRGDVQP